jgi:hypothetical protein
VRKGRACRLPLTRRSGAMDAQAGAAAAARECELPALLTPVAAAAAAPPAEQEEPDADEHHVSAPLLTPPLRAAAPPAGPHDGEAGELAGRGEARPCRARCCAASWAGLPPLSLWQQCPAHLEANPYIHGSYRLFYRRVRSRRATAARAIVQARVLTA